MVDAVVADRTVPHNLEAERSVLGAILLHDREAYPLAASGVSAGEFFRDAHRRIFEAMAKLAERGAAIDLVTLKDELGRAGDLDEVGGPVYITALLDGVPRSSNVEHYCRIVREKARLRGLIYAANRVLATAYGDEEAANAIIDRGVNELLALADVADQTVYTAGDVALDFVAGLDAGSASPYAPMPTGFTDLDEMLVGGLRQEDLVVVAGRPSMGKSSLALAMARGLARAGHAAAVFPLEMRARALGARLVCWDARIDRARLQRGFMSDRDGEKLARAVGALAETPLYIRDSVSTLTEVSAWCQRLQRDKGIRAAVIDFLQMMMPERPGQNRERDVAALSSGLKRLARRLGIVVIVVSALNRAPEGRRDNRPRLSDMRESGAIESDADVAILVHRPGYYDKSDETEGIAEIIVAKNRDGATGTVKLCFIEQFGGAFENLAVGAN